MSIKDFNGQKWLLHSQISDVSECGRVPQGAGWSPTGWPTDGDVSLRLVTLRGRYCKCCRSTDHQCKQCVCWREPQCGRCGLPWKALTAEGRSHHLHDCEGGPTGFGPEHIDPLGSAWAEFQRAARAELVPAPAEDPAAQSRSASLAAAKDYARRHKGNIAKRGRSSSANSTPPSQHQKDDSNITPLIV